MFRELSRKGPLLKFLKWRDQLLDQKFDIFFCFLFPVSDYPTWSPMIVRKFFLRINKSSVFEEILTVNKEDVRPRQHVSGYFWIRSSFFTDSNISPSTLSTNQSEFAAEFAGCVWTEAVSGKKKLRIQKYPNTCGQSLWFRSGSFSLTRDTLTSTLNCTFPESGYMWKKNWKTKKQLFNQFFNLDLMKHESQFKIPRRRPRPFNKLLAFFRFPRYY